MRLSNCEVDVVTGEVMHEAHTVSAVVDSGDTHPPIRKFLQRV